MLYTGKLLYAELYDDSTYPYTNVKAVWETNRDKHPGRLIVTNADWHDPGPKPIGNYKIDGRVLSQQYASWPGFGWNAGELPHMVRTMTGVDNFVGTIPALIGGERQSLSYGAGVERSTTRTWFGVDAAGEWYVEVTMGGYTLEGIVERMEALGIVDGIVLDGSGSSQWYDGERHITGDGRTVYSYLLLWFEETGEDKPGKGDEMSIDIIDAGLEFGALTKRTVTDRIILHHAAGNGSVESVHNYHKSLGWSGIGYHYYVRKDGSIYRGRPEEMVGGHTSGYNYCSIGVCAEGNFETESMSDAQREAIRALVLDIRTRYPDTQTIRHKDVAATACPGKNYPFDYIAAAEPDPEDTPPETDTPSGMDWETERTLAREWAMNTGLSDGERPRDSMLREEYWVSEYRKAKKEGKE